VDWVEERSCCVLYDTICEKGREGDVRCVN
jgi:hypothetical protein